MIIAGSSALVATGSKVPAAAAHNLSKSAAPGPFPSKTKQWISAGKPVMGIRTSSHPFAARPKGNGYQPPAGHVEWQDFDREVLGADYTGHYRESDGECLARLNPKQSGHPILQNLKLPSPAKVPSHLYRSEIEDLQNTSVLVNGVIAAKHAVEPIAWTRTSR